MTALATPISPEAAPVAAPVGGGLTAPTGGTTGTSGSSGASGTSGTSSAGTSAPLSGEASTLKSGTGASTQQSSGTISTGTNTSKTGSGSSSTTTKTATKSTSAGSSTTQTKPAPITLMSKILALGEDPAYTYDSKIGPKITGLFDYQLINYDKPLIKGVGPANGTLKITILDSKNAVQVSEVITIGENEVFLFETPNPLKDGKYTITLKIVTPSTETVKTSKPLHFTVNSKLNVTEPNSNLEITNTQPIINGKTGQGSFTIASWQSVVLTSALLADSDSGEFSLQPNQKLPSGDHTVYVQAVRPEDGAMSKTSKISFTIEDEKPIVTQETPDPANNANLPAQNTPQTDSNNQQIFYLILGGVLLVAVLAGGAYAAKRKK